MNIFVAASKSAVLRRRRIRALLAAPAMLVLTFTVVGVSCIPPPDPLPPGSVCSVQATELVCPYQTMDFNILGEHRQVHWQVPRTTPPAGGWPAVLMFQGTAITAEISWHASKATALGGYYQTQVVQHLLDAGYAVFTPETHLDGATFWDTNNPFVPDYLQSNDHAFMLAILDGIGAGSFGALDATRLYATGISSGGYMTSRMAVSYPGRFRALAIESGSYATCAGPICTIGPIAADHPPTLFLHGQLDVVVPVWTMEMYADALDQHAIANRKVIDPIKIHEWIPAAPAEALAWFDAHP